MSVNSHLHTRSYRLYWTPSFTKGSDSPSVRMALRQRLADGRAPTSVWTTWLRRQLHGREGSGLVSGGRFRLCDTRGWQT